jgi:uridine kinase
MAAMLLYWLSPIALYVGYWHGQLDILPVTLLVAALTAIANARHIQGGLWLGSAVAAKFSMGLALPFIGLFYFGRRRQRPFAAKASFAAALAIAVLVGPLLGSAGFREMVLLTPESAKTFSLALEFGPSLRLYLLPLAYLALLYWAWRVRRIDFDMLCYFIGIGFMALLLLTPAAPGWALWAMPFVALHTARAGRTGQILFWLFTLAFVALHLLVSTGATIAGVDLTAAFAVLFPERLPSILLTLMLGAGAALTLQMVRNGVLASGFYRASRKPFAIAISGDSGTGKDTLVDALEAMFGPRSFVRLSGDDYHSWDRQKPMWRAMTHLNPMANDLENFAAHVTDLVDGKAVRARHYDHGSGRAGELQALRPRDILAVSGLHALWSPVLNARFDVRVFMDMDEALRRFLKMRRDVTQRGHAPEKVMQSIERRASDGAQFIAPQAAAADVVLRLEPRHPTAIADTALAPDATMLRLVVTFAPGRNFEAPARLLTALSGMQVIETFGRDGRAQVLIEGEPSAADIAATARRVAPDMHSFLAVDPVWRPGLSGVMQIILLTEIDRSRRRRGFAA